MRILFSEDQPDIAEVMIRLLVHAGHLPTLATNGRETLRLAEEVSPEVVLLDINMPGIDGYETARRLRNRYGHRFPIYAVTANPMDVSLAQQSGFDGIFSKPFDVRKLAAIEASLL